MRAGRPHFKCGTYSWLAPSLIQLSCSSPTSPDCHQAVSSPQCLATKYYSLYGHSPNLRTADDPAQDRRVFFDFWPLPRPFSSQNSATRTADSAPTSALSQDDQHTSYVQSGCSNRHCKNSSLESNIQIACRSCTFFAEVAVGEGRTETARPEHIQDNYSIQECRSSQRVLPGPSFATSGTSTPPTLIDTGEWALPDDWEILLSDTAWPSFNNVEEDYNLSSSIDSSVCSTGPYLDKEKGSSNGLETLSSCQQTPQTIEPLDLVEFVSPSFEDQCSTFITDMETEIPSPVMYPTCGDLFPFTSQKLPEASTLSPPSYHSIFEPSVSPSPIPASKPTIDCTWSSCNKTFNSKTAYE
jgi:hypothetical protein